MFKTREKLALLLLVSAGFLAANQPRQHEDSRTARAQGIEKDLRLVVRLVGARKVEPGMPVGVRMELVNTSREKTYDVVKPGDGSTEGRRPPHVFYTAVLVGADGKSRSVPTARYFVCADFDWKWQKDIVALGPGQKLQLKDWLPNPSNAFELQEAGRVRLVVHYRCVSVREGAPAFEVASDPVEFEVVRPLDLVLKVRRPLRTGVETRLSDLFDVTLVNCAKEPLQVIAPTLEAGAQLRLEIRGTFNWPPRFNKQLTNQGDTQMLKPGETAALLGQGDLCSTDGTWTYPKAETVRVRALYMGSTNKPGPIILSNWVDIKVEGEVRAGTKW